MIVMMFDQICMSDWSSAAGATCEAEVRGGGGRERGNTDTCIFIRLTWFDNSVITVITRIIKLSGPRCISKGWSDQSHCGKV